jgi:hypothetical protein
MYEMMRLTKGMSSVKCFKINISKRLILKTNV